MFVRTILLISCFTLAAGCKDAPAPAADKAPAPAQAKEGEDAHKAFSSIGVDQLSKLVDDGKAVPVDANGKKTRTKYGTIPKAVLLSNVEGYDTAELPDDKGTKLVFYCYNEKCSSAPSAAKLAAKAGYTDVNVLPQGIKGWVAAGKSVDKPQS